MVKALEDVIDGVADRDRFATLLLRYPVFAKDMLLTGRRMHTSSR